MDQGLIDNTLNFGERLKRAREQAGFNLETLSRRLHIRPDIISAIENCDFRNMPATGYAKNMIRSYARCVGLNQNEIAELYLQALAVYERTDVRDDNDRSQSGSQRSKLRRASFLDLDTSQTHTSREIYSDRAPRTSRSKIEDDSNKGSSRGSLSRRSGHKYYSHSGTRKQVTTKSMQSTYSLGGSPRPSIPNFDYQKLIVPVVVIVIIVLVIMIFSLAFGKGGADNQEDVPTMPISGLTDTSNKDEETSNNTTTKTLVDHATFKVEVASGSESWCTVELDGTQSFADIISGPDSKTFDVKGTLEFSTANSSPVKVFIDDVEQTLTADATTGMYVFSYTFDSASANKTS